MTLNSPEIVHLVASPGSVSSVGRLMPVVLCARAIQEGLRPPGHVVLIGDRHSAEQARSLGLRFDRRLAPPMGRPEMLARPVRALTAGAKRVVCWNDELGVLLNRIGVEADLISTRPALAPSRLRKHIGIRVFERSDRDHWEAKNHTAELDTVLAPLVDELGARARPITREQLGIIPGSVCLGVIADRPRDIDARAFCFLLGLLNASGYRLSGVVPQGASHLAAARRHHRALGEHFQLLIARDPITTILPVFDALLHPCFDGTGSSMLLERMCENADTPVLRLRGSGRAGLSRAPGIAGPVIEFLDEFVHTGPAPANATEPIHA